VDRRVRKIMLSISCNYRMLLERAGFRIKAEAMWRDQAVSQTG
jgi:hypothetical protein